MTRYAFTKMHGLGNDFVVLDARKAPIPLGEKAARAISDRHTGVGCDQILIIEKPKNGSADAFMRIRNADGSEVAACGNGARCVAALLMQEAKSARAVVETAAGTLEARSDAGGLVTVDMGPVSFEWRRIPLARDADTLHLPIAMGVLKDPVAVNVGNPHAVFFVGDAESVPLADLGPQIEHHPLFPERTNVEAAQVLDRTRIRLRVWERGVGITQACGSGACATVAAAHRRGLTEAAVDVALDGGTLRIALDANNRALMTGPVAVSFTGALDDALWARP
ncbi:MAG: diaminopimelate epimerase [Rhodospirillales bacterium]|nr:diaminopimelate epimerase [Rhodospirillales bacterium]